MLSSLKEFDVNNDGQIDATELAQASQAYASLKRAAAEGLGEIPLSGLPFSLQPLRASLDVDTTGTVSAAELATAMELYVQSKNRVKQLSRMVFWICLLMGLLLAAIAGVTIAVVELSKDTDVSSGGAMTVKGHPDTAVQTAAFLTPAALSSEMGDDDWMELKVLTLTSPAGARMNLAVTGTVRVPFEESCHGSVVRVLTAVGTITLDGKDLVFGGDVDDALFREAGFILSTGGAGKKLLGAYTLLGMFNLLSGLELVNPPCRGDKPGIPKGDFQMTLTVSQACDTDQGDLCLNPVTLARYPHTETVHGREYVSYKQRVMKIGDSMMTASQYAYAPGFARFELLDNSVAARRLTSAETGGISQRRLESLTDEDLTGKDIATWTAKIVDDHMLASTNFNGTDTLAYKCRASTVPPQIFSKLDSNDVVFEFVSYETEALPDGGERTLRRYRLTVDNQIEVAEGEVNTVETIVDYLDEEGTGFPVMMVRSVSLFVRVSLSVCV